MVYTLECGADSRAVCQISKLKPFILSRDIILFTYIIDLFDKSYIILQHMRIIIIDRCFCCMPFTAAIYVGRKICIYSSMFLPLLAQIRDVEPAEPAILSASLGRWRSAGGTGVSFSLKLLSRSSMSPVTEVLQPDESARLLSL